MDAQKCNSCINDREDNCYRRHRQFYVQVTASESFYRRRNASDRMKNAIAHRTIVAPVAVLQ